MFAILRVHSRRRRGRVSQCGIEQLERRCLLQATAAQYVPVSLVADSPLTITFSITTPAKITDPNLVNPWGLVSSPTGPFWVANNGTGTATTYNDQGQPQSIVVTIPSPPGSIETATPTGAVFNGGSGFAVTANGLTAPATFLFATEQGTISGWNPAVNSTAAVLMVDRSVTNTIYKGLATATVNGARRLYATDFHNARVDVFDANFKPVTTTGRFTDPKLPSMYAPFGIANINGLIYVTYARQDAARENQIAGQGRGFVDIYTPDGVLVKRLIRQGQLSAPWGMTVAPVNFGAFSNDLLVGNFGNGRINAYNPVTGKFIGTLRDSGNRPITIEGLWSLKFGNGVDAGATNSLFFTAGPGLELKGIFGRISAVNPTGRLASTPPARNSAPPSGANSGGSNPAAGMDAPMSTGAMPTRGSGLTISVGSGMLGSTDGGLSFVIRTML